MLTAAKQLEGIPKPTYRKGRICRGCNAQLSIYNRKWYCAQCRPEGRTLSPLDKQSERERFIDTLRELMEET